MPRNELKIAVIGGGMAGLQTAVAALEKGAQVHLFEAGPRTRTRHVNWDVQFHRGDEKVQNWTCDRWGPGGGLAMRLGGRSLCYHGVLLAQSADELQDWPPIWRERLIGDNGYYDRTLLPLRGRFPELSDGGFSARAAASGLSHVPQAARLTSPDRFEAYSPLSVFLEAEAKGRVVVRQAHVSSVAREKGQVRVTGFVDEGIVNLGKFDACVLAASAIGNLQLISQSLGTDIHGKITDHFCVGAFVRLPKGPPLSEFRHPMLWTGFAQSESLGANTFFLERPALAQGDRLIEIMTVVEQTGGPEAHSDILVHTTHDRGGQTLVRANVAPDDQKRLNLARAEIEAWAEKIAQGVVRQIVPSHELSAETRSGKHDGTDQRWFDHDAAIEAVANSDTTNVYSFFELPYGAFEHEACTHPIGRGKFGVTDDLELADIPGVYVAGPGIFPRLGVANPALTILATSNWLGDHLGRGGMT